MAETAPYIGSVTFPGPPDLIWVNKNEQFTAGSDTRTRSGDMVSIVPESVSQNHLMARCIFHWLPRSDLDTLRGYARLRTTYNAILEPNGSVKAVRFAAKNGVDESKVKHEAFGDEAIHTYLEGEDTDIYTGELNLIIEVV